LCALREAADIRIATDDVHGCTQSAIEGLLALGAREIKIRQLTRIERGSLNRSDD
jgi:hypothetical protein